MPKDALVEASYLATWYCGGVKGHGHGLFNNLSGAVSYLLAYAAPGGTYRITHNGVVIANGDVFRGL